MTKKKENYTTLIVQPHEEPDDNEPSDPFYPERPEFLSTNHKRRNEISKLDIMKATLLREIEDWFWVSGYNINIDNRYKHAPSSSKRRKVETDIVSFTDRNTALYHRLPNTRTLIDEIGDFLDPKLFPSELKLNMSNTDKSKAQSYIPHRPYVYMNANDDMNMEAIVDNNDNQAIYLDDDDEKEDDDKGSGDYDTNYNDDGHDAFENTNEAVVT